jgi:transposase-like protein
MENEKPKCHVCKSENLEYIGSRQLDDGRLVDEYKCLDCKRHIFFEVGKVITGPIDLDF